MSLHLKHNPDQAGIIYIYAKHWSGCLKDLALFPVLKAWQSLHMYLPPVLRRIICSPQNPVFVQGIHCSAITYECLLLSLHKNCFNVTENINQLCDFILIFYTIFVLILYIFINTNTCTLAFLTLDSSLHDLYTEGSYDKVTILL